MSGRLSRLAVVLACLTLAPLSAGHAQTSHPAVPPQPAPLSCTAGAVTVEAQPDTQGRFPAPVPCPANSLGVTECSKWSHKYTIVSGGGNNISVSAVTAGTDFDIVAVSGGPTAETEVFLPSGGKLYNPGETDSSIGAVVGQHFRTVKLAAQGSVFYVNLYTRRDVVEGSITAVARVGNTGAGSCRVAGASHVDTGGATVGIAPITTTQVDHFGECAITLTLDRKGCVTDAVATPSDTCTVQQLATLDGTPNGKAILGGACNAKGFTTEGSTCVWYCPTSFGGCFQICF